MARVIDAVILITGATGSAMSTTLGIPENEAVELKKKVKEFQDSSDMVLEPGHRFVFTGTLSLTQTVYVMNENVQFDKKDCWTGSTNKSNNAYTISKHFSKLNSHKKTVTVYS